LAFCLLLFGSFSFGRVGFLGLHTTSRFAQLPLPIAPISIICPGLSSPSHTKLPSLRYKSKSFSGLDTRSAPIDFVHFVFFDANP
jgi:hypothetical protein